ncbi:hypothetical protein U1Q18_027457, partial [Sarracenia purpurea var. burkii]
DPEHSVQGVERSGSDLTWVSGRHRGFLAGSDERSGENTRAVSSWGSYICFHRRPRTRAK